MSILLDRLTALDVPGQWKDHPSFPGVRLRRLVSGDETAGRFTTLLVSIAPNGKMLPHRHETEVEQHLILSGGGQMALDGHQDVYSSGSLKIIPQGALHSVTAGEDGMTILALFSPALP